MPFDPNIPQENTPLDAAQMRAQFNALHGDIQTRVTNTELTAGMESIAVGSSASTNAVNFLSITISDPPGQGELQAVVDKINEMLAAMRR